MHKILQNHLLCAFVANLKIGAIYALYPESFCDKNLAIRKVFAFCDSEKKGKVIFLKKEKVIVKRKVKVSTLPMDEVRIGEFYCQTKGK